MGDPGQVYVNSRGLQQHQFDAIVVGSGISGGWAAKELCEKGLKTLVIERGRNVVHIKDYPTAMMAPWDFPHGLLNTIAEETEDPVSSENYNPGTKSFYVRDRDHPYIQDDPFHWVRGYQVGGRSLTWGRQCYRLSDLDLEANLKDGHGVDWPIRYRDLESWYNYVEEFTGISGRAEGLSQLPDGDFLPPIEMNCIEDYFAKKISSNYHDRVVTPARVANLSKGWKGRGPCQFRNLCGRQVFGDESLSGRDERRDGRSPDAAGALTGSRVFRTKPRLAPGPSGRPRQNHFPGALVVASRRLDLSVHQC
jgi:choline dehydrogenase-like flavoprotein